MSGVTVLFARGGNGVNRSELEVMLDRIDHRGPDGRSAWCDGRVGLGHQQLASTPQAVYDDQPYRDGGLVVTADARLDNRPELFDRLAVEGAPETVPDSQLLLDAYRAWGERCVEEFAGAYSFVIYDEDRERLFCARDHFGVKPFYYHVDEDLFAVASEKKALLSLPSVPGAVDEMKIGDFLVDYYEDRARSFFQSIKRLPPASAITVEPTATNKTQYWDLDPTRRVTLESDAAYERRFRELFERAVRSRLRTKGRVGAALSGGMDSSSITVVARDLLPDSQPLQTFSNVFDDAPSSDEREFIETVTTRDGIESHYVFLDDVGALVDEQQLRTYFDKPPHNTMHFGAWERTKRAAEVDVDAVLGGALGDSAIGYGLGLLPQLLWTGRWRYLYSELRAMSDVVNAPAKEMFVRHALSDVVPYRVGRLRRRLNGDPVGTEAANPTLDHEFVKRTGLGERYVPPGARGAAVTPRSRRRQRRSLLTGKNATNFEAIDLIHAAFGIEPRFPFADKRLVEYSLAIPPSQQFSDGWTRSIGRRALDDLLPDKIQWRPWKTFLNEAFWNALSRERSRLNSLVDDPAPVGEYLDDTALRASHQRFEEDPQSRDARALWRALALSVWLDEYGSATDCESRTRIGQIK